MLATLNSCILPNQKHYIVSCLADCSTILKMLYKEYHVQPNKVPYKNHSKAYHWA